jgi:hypothetical protein
MTTPLQALAQLSHKDPTPEYFARFHAEISAENNHRGAVILLASNTEICLRYAIRRHLAKTDYTETEQLLYRTGGPLRSFEAKIRVGYTMGIYGAQTKNNLDCIKGLRNAFAHAVIPIDFDTPEVNAVCEQMTMPEILAPRAIEAATGLPTGRLPDLVMPRQRFQKICEAVAHNLFVVRSIGILP